MAIILLDMETFILQTFNTMIFLLVCLSWGTTLLRNALPLDGESI